MVLGQDGKNEAGFYLGVEESSLPRFPWTEEHASSNLATQTKQLII